jgi:hypothetical protein
MCLVYVYVYVCKIYAHAEARRDCNLLYSSLDVKVNVVRNTSQNRGVS